MKTKLSAGFVGLALALGGWLAPALAEAASVKLVQTGTVTMSTSPQTPTITQVDMSRSFVVCSNRVGGDAASSYPSNRATCELTSPTQVTITTGGTHTANVVRWYVVEFEGGVYVERGTAAFTTSSTSPSPAVPALTGRDGTGFDLTKSFVLTSERTTSTSVIIDEEWTVRGRLTTATNLELTRNESGIAVTVAWQVIQMEGASVQRNLTTIAKNTTSSTAAITSVSTTTSFLVMSRRGGTAVDGIEARYQARGELTSATQLTFTRGNGENINNNTVEIAWEVVSLSDGGEVRKGAGASTATGTGVTGTFSAITTSRTVPFVSASVETGGGTYNNNLDETSWTATFTDTTTLQLERVGTGLISTVAWFVAQFFQCAAGSPSDLSYVSAKSNSATQVTLYWPSSQVIVLRKGPGGTGFTSGDFPVNGNSYTSNAPGGATVISNTGTATTSFTDTVTAGQKYYYKVVARSGPNGPCYAPGAASKTEVSITPGQTSVAWSYTATGGPMLNPGITGNGTIYPSSSAGRIVSLDTADGTQSSTWTAGPVTTTGAVQGWLTWVPLKGGTTNVVIAGDQAPGGKVYARNAATGAVVSGWTDYQTSPVTPIQAGVAVQLWDYSNPAFQTQTSPYDYTNTDIIFAATMNGSTTNKLYAIKASNGTSPWSFNGTVESGTSVSDISGMPYVDYARNRIYVASKATSGRSLWVINTLTGSSVACNSTDCDFTSVGTLDSSPTLSYSGTTLYVGNATGTANLYALTTGTTPALTLKWTAPFPLGAGNGYVQGFVWEDYTTAGRLYFTTTTGRVMCVQDNGIGTSPTACTGWTVNTFTGAGTPLLNSTGSVSKLFFGATDGKVHQINLTSGNEDKQFPAGVGNTLDGTQVGAVSTETGGEIFVGTNGAKIFRINLVSGELP